MNEADIAAAIREGMLTILKIGGPLLLVGLAVGLAMALLQAVTQVNEATLAFVPKVIALGLTLLLLGPFMFGALSSYTHHLFDRMVSVGAR
jgi:flagellar biosynthetic protein FliQ